MKAFKLTGVAKSDLHCKDLGIFSPFGRGHNLWHNLWGSGKGGTQKFSVSS